MKTAFRFFWIACLGFCATTRAADIVWTNAASGSWNVAANWSPNTVPGASDHAFITNNGTYAVTLNASATLAGFTLGGTSGTQTFNHNFRWTLTLNGAGTVRTYGVFNLSSGELGGLNGTADMTCAGVFNWTAGTMSGSGRMIIPTGGTLNLSGAQHNLNRALQNNGTANWTGGNLYLNGVTLTNNGSFTVNNGSFLFCFGGTGSSVFANAGSFTKQGAGLAGFDYSSDPMFFHNTGTLNVQNGTLELYPGGTHSGDFVLDDGATLRLGRTHSMSAAVDLTGAGSLRVDGSLTHAGTVNLGGTAMFSGVTATFTGPSFAAGVLTVNSGTANLSSSAAITLGSVNLTLGTLGGTADVTCTNVFNWTAGTMGGSGRTIIAAGGTLNVSSNNEHNLNRVLQNDGTATWTAGHLFLTGGTFTNNGSFTASSGAALDCYGNGGVNAFHNAGTFNKQGAGLTRFFVSVTGVAFNNTGSVDVQAGTLAFNSGFTQTSGQTMLSGGAISASSTMQIQGGVLGGVGTISASVNSSGTVSPGASPGRLTIAGTYTQTASGVLNIELAGTTAGTTFDVLGVTGAATLAGTLTVTLTGGFYPATNAAFTCLTGGSRSGTFATFYFPSNDVGMTLSYAASSATINVINVRPVIPAIATQTNAELVLFSYASPATDADVPVQTLTYSLSNSPAGASINGSGVISWTPTEAQGPMTTNITVRVTDSGVPNLTVWQTFAIVATEINVAPVLTLPANSAFDELTPYTNNATAPDADLPVNTLIFELVSGPADLLVETNGAISWTPAEAQGPSNHVVSIRVTDLNTNAVNEPQLSVTNSFTLTVNESNRPPVLTVPASQTLTEETPLAVSASVADPDVPVNGLVFSLLAPPSGLTIDSGSGAISWTPTEAQGSNSYTVTVVVTDDSPFAINETHLSATNSFLVTVLESNRPPVLTLPTNQTLVELTSLNVTASATDPDVPGNTLLFALIASPAGMTMDAGSGAIAWTPTEAQGSNTYTIFVSVTDTNPLAFNTTSLSVTGSFTITVLESNRPPVLTVPGNSTFNELVPFTAQAGAFDPAAPTNVVTLALVSGPAGLTVAPDGLIAWTPTEAQGPGVFTVVLSVTDTNEFASNAKSLSVTNSFTLTVREVNVPPVFTLPASTNIQELIPFTVSNMATDADLPFNFLSFTLLSGPPGLTLSSGGVLNWTPSAVQGPGTNVVVMYVTDFNFSAVNTTSFSVTNTITIVVIDTNTPPVVPDFTASTDWNTLLTISTNKLLGHATDAEGDALIITSATSTNGATVTLSSGVMSYLPVTNYAGADRVDFVVSDGHHGAVGHVFITVRSNNTAGLNILSIVNNGGASVTITFAGIRNRYYIVQSTTNLALPVPPNWKSISTNQANANGIWTYTDPVTPGSRFYRSTGGTQTPP